MLEDAQEKMNAKDNAQASIPLKINVKPPVSQTKQLATEELTKHFEKQFSTTGGNEVADFPTRYIQLVG